MSNSPKYLLNRSFKPELVCLRTVPLIVVATAFLNISTPASAEPSPPVTASTWYEVTRGRPLINSWNSEHLPSNFDEWPQDTRTQYLENQEQISATITRLSQMKCSQLPCLIAKDLAGQLYNKSGDLKHKYERGINRAEMENRSTTVAAIALGVGSIIAGATTGNIALIVTGISINATHLALNYSITNGTAEELNQELERTKTIMASEKHTLDKIEKSLEEADRLAEDARTRILRNLALEYDGQPINLKIPELITLFKNSQDLPAISLEKTNTKMLAIRFADFLEAQLEDEVFALNIFNKTTRNRAGNTIEIPLIFKIIRHGDHHFAVIPGKSGHVYFEFREAGQLLSFFANLASRYRSEEVTFIRLIAHETS
ncbi:hypothetical protein [Parendozoicomonas sp. Alg238-R29]|uniref:hypothetical protein n=1 Tax=Parendozoicomonas sp. Alg238-R29 TaxID=2993446 RepID=UPI00248F34A5|nr:hypothetical protein [Parendozoicomonas sp. Alg238-R29]